MLYVTLLQCALCLLLFAGIYHLAAIALNIPNRAAVKTIRRTGAKARKSFLQLILTPIRKLLSGMIKVAPHRRQQLAIYLNRLNIAMTPEEYVASAWSVSLLMGALAVPCWIAGSSISAIGCMALAVTMYFHEMQSAARSLEVLNERINGELPGFVRSITAGIESRIPLNDCVSGYISNKPDSAMRKELTKLATGLGLENQKEALLAFEASINLPQLRSVTPVLIAASEGTSDNGQLLMLANQMDALAEERLQRTLQKRQGKIKKATLAIMVCAVFMMIAPLVAQIVDGFSVAFG